jgi:hypothetical protein
VLCRIRRSVSICPGSFKITDSWQLRIGLKQYLDVWQEALIEERIKSIGHILEFSGVFCRHESLADTQAFGVAHNYLRSAVVIIVHYKHILLF